MVKQFRPGFLALTAVLYPLEFGCSFLDQLGGDFKSGENLGHYSQLWVQLLVLYLLVV